MPNYKQDAEKQSPAALLLELEQMRKDNFCTCAGGSWYSLHQYDAMEPKKIMWEHAGNKGTFGNSEYVTLT